MRELEYDSSSTEDDVLPNTPSLCHVSSKGDEFTIAAKSTTDYAIKMSQNSFVFKRKNTDVTLQFNRMFLWRLLKSSHLKNENEEIDVSNLCDFIAQIKDSLVIIVIQKGCVNFNFNGLEKTVKIDDESKIYDNFDQLYYTCTRKYETNTFIDNILKTSIALLSTVKAHF